MGELLIRNHISGGRDSAPATLRAVMILGFEIF
jgi:hypothetical protein